MHLKYVKDLFNNLAVLVAQYVSRSTVRDLAVAEVFSAVENSPEAQLEYADKKKKKSSIEVWEPDSLSVQFLKMKVVANDSQ